MSLSARRAWIEIALDGAIRDAHGRVALRKESVDRNQLIGAGCAGTQVSLSARRAWIEMRYRPAAISPSPSVALRKESVDRNIYGILHLAGQTGRSPQGERG